MHRHTQKWINAKVENLIKISRSHQYQFTGCETEKRAYSKKEPLFFFFTTEHKSIATQNIFI